MYLVIFEGGVSDEEAPYLASLSAISFPVILLCLGTQCSLTVAFALNIICCMDLIIVEWDLGLQLLIRDRAAILSVQMTVF